MELEGSGDVIMFAGCVIALALCLSLSLSLYHLLIEGKISNHIEDCNIIEGLLLISFFGFRFRI